MDHENIDIVHIEMKLQEYSLALELEMDFMQQGYTRIVCLQEDIRNLSHLLGYMRRLNNETS